MPWEAWPQHPNKKHDVRAAMKAELEEAWREILETGDQPEASPPGHSRVVLCGTCLGRDWQARIALPINCLLCWRRRQWVEIAVVPFGADRDLLGELLGDLYMCFEAGLLRVASGGDAGLRA